MCLCFFGEGKDEFFSEYVGRFQSSYFTNYLSSQEFAEQKKRKVGFHVKAANSQQRKHF